MSDACPREWRFYLDDMIDFAGKVLAYTGLGCTMAASCVAVGLYSMRIVALFISTTILGACAWPGVDWKDADAYPYTYDGYSFVIYQRAPEPPIANTYDIIVLADGAYMGNHRYIAAEEAAIFAHTESICGNDAKMVFRDNRLARFTCKK